ncbi:hypothetical protein Tco_0501816 [Tanacetum coccineum]
MMDYLIAWVRTRTESSSAIFSDPPICSRPGLLDIIVRRTRGELALASRRHVSTRGWSAVIGAVAGATGLRWLTMVNDGEPPVNHRSTAVGPPVNHPEPPVNGSRTCCHGENKDSILSIGLLAKLLEAKGWCDYSREGRRVVMETLSVHFHHNASPVCCILNREVVGSL